jgi:hypothetical protein
VPVVQFGCPFCGAVAEVDAGLAGQETVCPACECVLIVPHPEAAPLDGGDSAPTAPREHSAPDAAAGSPKAKSAKAKLWQAASRPAAGADATRSQSVTGLPAAPDLLAEPEEPADPFSPFGGPLDNIAASSPLARTRYGRSASDIARQERERRRFWSNAVMLVGSVTILCLALAVLMYLTGK